jgi:hypothetical protein
MRNDDIVIRPATEQDAIDYWGCTPKSSFTGYVADLDGRIIGIGGVFYDGGVPVAFSEMKPEMRLHRKSVARGVRVLEKLFNRHGMVFSFVNQDEPTALNLQTKLGFVPTVTTIDGKGTMFMRMPKCQV